MTNAHLAIKRKLLHRIRPHFQKFGSEIATQAYDAIEDTLPFGSYFSNLREELDYEVAINLPDRFPNGSIFRAGPGVYSRGNQRRNNVIDADGMIRQYQFCGDKLRVRAKVLNTQRAQQEEEYNGFLYPSFSMRPTTSFFNSIANLKNQASLAVTSFGGKLLVSDEVQPQTALDESLNVISENFLGNEKQYAHQKLVNGLLHCLRFRPSEGGVSVVTYDENFSVISESDVVSLHSTCIHDWSVTENYFAFVLPSNHVSELGIVQALFGLKTLAQSVNYKEDKSSLLVLVCRETGKVSMKAPLRNDLTFWHHVNAYEQDSRLTIRFIGNDDPNDISDENSPCYQLMQGVDGQGDKDQNTYVHKVEVDLDEMKVLYDASEPCDAKGLEMPTLNQNYQGRCHRYFYATQGPEFLQHSIVKVDTNKQEKVAYRFPEAQYISEALFMPAKDATAEDDGFLVVDVHDGARRKNTLCVFDAQKITSGPVLSHELPIALPIAFHGTWRNECV